MLRRRAVRASSIVCGKFRPHARRWSISSNRVEVQEIHCAAYACALAGPDLCNLQPLAIYEGDP